MRTPPSPLSAPAAVGLEDAAVALVHCPQCDDVASIEWHTTVRGTSYVKVRCIHRHWFLLPGDMVTAYASVGR